jgi:hypothetical protein
VEKPFLVDRSFIATFTCSRSLPNILIDFGAAKERDACAQECVAISVDYWMGDAQFEAATRCCNAIRARGTKEGA